MTVSRDVPGSCVSGCLGEGIFFIFGLLELHFGPSFPGVWLLSSGRPDVERLDSPRGRRGIFRFFASNFYFQSKFSS